MIFSAYSDSDFSLSGTPIQDVSIKILPYNHLARLLWKWLRFNIKCTWVELPKEN